MAFPSERDLAERCWSIGRWWSAFARDERGTALTELLLTLPVFIIIFAGMQHLTYVEHKAVRVKIRANKDMWEHAMASANNTSLIPDPKEGIPTLAAVDALGTISNFPSEHGDMYGTMNNFGLAFGATKGESQRSTMVLRFMGQSPSGQVPGRNLRKYPRDMLDDSRWNPITSAPGALAIYTPVIPLSFIGPNQVPALGLRYGTSAGSNQDQVDLVGRTVTFKAAYDVANSPVSNSRWHDPLFVPGFSRLLAEKDPCLSNVLSLNTDMGYLSNCF